MVSARVFNVRLCDIFAASGNHGVHTPVVSELKQMGATKVNVVYGSDGINTVAHFSVKCRCGLY